MSAAQGPNITSGRTLGVQASTEFGVLFDPLHLEHYCQRIEEIDLPSLDEANFFTGALSAAVSMLVALLGVAIGTKDPSPYLIAVLVGLFFASTLAALFFWRRYKSAKETVGKKGKRVAQEFREIMAAQRRDEA